MATFRLHIDTENAAFDGDPAQELSRILTNIALEIEAGRDMSHYQTIFDLNGNDVGRYVLKEYA